MSLAFVKELQLATKLFRKIKFNKWSNCFPGWFYDIIYWGRIRKLVIFLPICQIDSSNLILLVSLRIICSKETKIKDFLSLLFFLYLVLKGLHIFIEHRKYLYVTAYRQNKNQPTFLMLQISMWIISWRYKMLNHYFLCS